MGLYWLASYPRSGNTWLRALLAHYLADASTPLPLDALGSDAVLASRSAVDDLLGLSTADLRADELARYLPRACRRLARDAGPTPCFVKVHAALERNDAGVFLYPPDATAGVVYVVRNPLDVAASMAPFFGLSAEAVVRRLLDPNYVLNPAADDMATVLPERLGSWSDHVRSWLDAPGYRVHLVRYEDLLEDTVGVFSGVLTFAGLDPDPGRVARAVANARFERLRAAEPPEGFHVLPTTAEASFFRSGRPGGWQEVLSPGQARALVAAHGAVLRRLGYDRLLPDLFGPSSASAAPGT